MVAGHGISALKQISILKKMALHLLSCYLVFARGPETACDSIHRSIVVIWWLCSNLQRNNLINSMRGFEIRECIADYFISRALASSCHSRRIAKNESILKLHLQKIIGLVACHPRCLITDWYLRIRSVQVSHFFILVKSPFWSTPPKIFL